MNLKARKIKDDLSSDRQEFDKKFPPISQKLGVNDTSNLAVWNSIDSPEGLMKGFLTTEIVLRKDNYELYGELKIKDESYTVNYGVTKFDDATGIWEDAIGGYPSEIAEAVEILGNAGEDNDLNSEQLERIYKVILEFDLGDEDTVSKKESEEGIEDE